MMSTIPTRTSAAEAEDRARHEAAADEECGAGRDDPSGIPRTIARNVAASASSRSRQLVEITGSPDVETNDRRVAAGACVRNVRTAHRGCRGRVRRWRARARSRRPAGSRDLDRIADRVDARTRNDITTRTKRLCPSGEWRMRACADCPITTGTNWAPPARGADRN